MTKKKQSQGIPWAGIILVSISFFVVLQAFTTPQGRTRTPNHPKDGDPCKGVPIEVGYEYDGALLGPHECVVQCDADEEMYVLYANGMATQCESLPGCSDWGEDHGIKCEPPMSQ